jgi:hypothetical protein
MMTKHRLSAQNKKMKFIFGIFIFFLPLFLQAEVTENTPTSTTQPSAPLAPTDSATQSISAKVRVIRGSPQTEVFFLDRKDSLVIPRNSQHNQILKACEDSMKKGTAVQLVIDSKNRQILSLPDATKEHVADGDKKIKDETLSSPSAEGAK